MIVLCYVMSSSREKKAPRKKITIVKKLTLAPRGGEKYMWTKFSLARVPRATLLHRGTLFSCEQALTKICSSVAFVQSRTQSLAAPTEIELRFDELRMLDKLFADINVQLTYYFQNLFAGKLTNKNWANNKRMMCLICNSEIDVPDATILVAKT